MRIHIHTDHPEKVFEKIATQGVIINQKVDDMVMQNEVVHNRKHAVALLTDSTCDLPEALMDEHQIHFVSLNLFLDGNQYLDKITISAEQFYDLMDKSPDFSQPHLNQVSVTLPINIISFLPITIPLLQFMHLQD